MVIIKNFRANAREPPLDERSPQPFDQLTSRALVPHWLASRTEPARSYGELCSMLIEAEKETGIQEFAMLDQPTSKAT